MSLEINKNLLSTASEEIYFNHDLFSVRIDTVMYPVRF